MQTAPLRLSTVLLATLALGCGKAGDEVSTETLASGTYTLDEDPNVTLVVDVDAASFTLDDGAGDTVSGTLTLLGEDDWTECCYLNGAGHTQFETYMLSESPLEIGPISLTMAHLSAEGPMLFEGSGDPDVEAVSGHAFSAE